LQNPSPIYLVASNDDLMHQTATHIFKNLSQITYMLIKSLKYIRSALLGILLPSSDSMSTLDLIFLVGNLNDLPVP
jgi:hypothetical protein